MRIIPVLDLKAGVAVHAVGGKRDTYRPIQTNLCRTADPEQVAAAFRGLGLQDLYVADLDAIGGQTPAIDLYRQLSATGMRLILDAGIRNESDWERLADVAVDAWIIGLETIESLPCLTKLVERIGPARLIFSLDLNRRRPLGKLASWRTSDPVAIADSAVAAGIRRMILLDLAQVGSGQGPRTDRLSTQILASHAKTELLVGGGIRGIEDLQNAKRLGVAGVLVATALHHGTLTRDQILACSRD